MRLHATNIGGNIVADYVPHHEPFQYYKSTSNPKHLPPSSEAVIGHTDQANHQYDISNFYTPQRREHAGGQLPQGAGHQDGHPGYSSPLDEQTFLVNTINQIEKSKFWPSTAIVITYDDSDGWYDHQVMPIVNGSNTSADTPFCSSAPTTLDNWTTRCGYGQRLPMLVISPGPQQLREQHPDRHRLNHQVHRGQLAPRAAALAVPSTRSRAAWTDDATCSTSGRGRTSGRSSSTRLRARSSAASGNWDDAPREARAS